MTTLAIVVLKVTGCQEFPQGNFLNWENTNWFLNSSRGTVDRDRNKKKPRESKKSFKKNPVKAKHQNRPSTHTLRLERRLLTWKKTFVAAEISAIMWSPTN